MASGDLDTSFDGNGKRNGRIVLAGTSTAAGAVVARLRTGGALDPDFAGDGRLSMGATGRCAPPSCSPDRRIVVAGQRSVSEDFAVAQLLG